MQRRAVVSAQRRLPSGRTECTLQVPVGHPCSRLVDQDGRTFEVEQRWRFRAGPGVSRVWNSVDVQEAAVGYDLRPASAKSTTPMCDAENLAAVMRRLANQNLR